MTPTNHLTDEQMYDLLDPAANTAAEQHLKSCAACQHEVASLRESLTNFRGAATNFAAIAGPRIPPVAARSTSFFGPKLWAASFATATAVLALSISMLHPIHNNTATAGVQTVVTTESDDALLDGIQKDLSTSIPPSLEPLAVPAASGETSTQN